jgi:hypothetical protein
MAEAAARLDRASLADGGRVTRALARAVLAGFPGLEGEIDDDSATAGRDVSTSTPRLL